MSLDDLYPGVKYTGAIEAWRKATDPESQSIIFAFDTVQADYYTIRTSLLEKYGIGSIDSMRLIADSSSKEGSEYASDDSDEFEDIKSQEEKCHSMIIETHFANDHKRRQAISESMLFQSLYLTINNQLVASKAMPMMSRTPPFVVYKVDDLPLRSSSDVCKVVWDCVEKRIQIMSTGRRWFKKTLKARLVDVVPSYDCEVFDKVAKKSHYIFTGSVHIVLAKSTDLGKRPYFRAYSARIKPMQ